MNFRGWGAIIAVCGSLIFAGSKAAAQTSYGTLDNFDVINDTGGECHGFEIELEGISAADVVYTFGAPYQRYGEPTIVPTATGVIVRYAAAYDASAQAWSATTPFTAPPYLPTEGHSCWTGGVADPAQYYAGGCDHFGTSLTATPTKTTYRWLVESAPGSGSLTPFGSNVAVPAPTWIVTPQPPPAPGLPPPPPIVQIAIAAPAPEQYEFGDALWVKLFVTELPDGVSADDLDHMVIDDPNANIVPHEPAEVEIEWILLQTDINGNGEQEFGGEAGAASEAVSRRLEFYKYVGQYDAETHEALCDNPERCPEAVGDVLGAQNVAVDLAGLIAAPNQAPTALPDSASTRKNTQLTIAAAALLNNDSDPEGDVLSIASVQNASTGSVVLSGSNVVFTPGNNFTGVATFSYTVSDGHGGSSTATVSVTVVAVNSPPVANAGADRVVRKGDTVILDGRLSYDADGNALSYKWVLTAKPSKSKATLAAATTAAPSFKADKEGTYTVSLVVNDGSVNSSLDTVAISATKK